MENSRLKIYIAASFKHLHGVKLLAEQLENLGCEILDWTAKATPPPGLTSAQKRIWMDTDQTGGQVFEFCKNACETADLVVYFGESGQDAGVEVGLAAGAGVPVLGIRGPLESPGLMLHGAVTIWEEDIASVISVIRYVLEIKNLDWISLIESSTPAFLSANILARKILARKTGRNTG